MLIIIYIKSEGRQEGAGGWGGGGGGGWVSGTGREREEEKNKCNQKPTFYLSHLSFEYHRASARHLQCMSVLVDERLCVPACLRYRLGEINYGYGYIYKLTMGMGTYTNHLWAWIQI